MELKIGADPEFFLWDNKLERFVSGHNILTGTKKNPKPLKKGALQRDGLAGEFNINPADSLEEFIDNIQVTVSEIDQIIKNVSKNLQMKFVPYAKFDPKYFSRVPSLWKILGCEPDFEGESLTPKQPAEGFEEQPFRTAGGHLHLGWREPLEVDDTHLADCVQVVKNVCYNMKIPEGNKSDEIARKTMYGNGFSWRGKPYGLEFRSPSNHWVNSVKNITQVYNSTQENWKEFINKMG